MNESDERPVQPPAVKCLHDRQIYGCDRVKVITFISAAELLVLLLIIILLTQLSLIVDCKGPAAGRWQRQVRALPLRLGCLIAS